MDLARAPRRTARKKGSGYENGEELYMKKDFTGTLVYILVFLFCLLMF
jgi:hypothetical protein